MERIQAMMVFEILGKPADHVLQSLKVLVEKLGAEKGVKLLNKQVHEPILVKDSKEIFTTFAEVDVEFENLELYLAVLFAYMPSNVEVISPEKIMLTNNYFNDIVNKLLYRLHNYDAITKKSIVDKEIVLNALKDASPEAFNKLTTPPQQKAPQQTAQQSKQEAPKKYSKKKAK